MRTIPVLTSSEVAIHAKNSEALRKVIFSNPVVQVLAALSKFSAMFVAATVNMINGQELKYLGHRSTRIHTSHCCNVQLL